MNYAVSRGPWLRRTLLKLLVTLLLAVANLTVRAQVIASVPVRYDAVSNTIYVGDNYTDPVLASYPSAPNAPKSPITIPEIAAALSNDALLDDQDGGAWLLKADLVVSPTARLEATSATLAWLRLDSTPGRSPGYTRLVASGGHVLIQGVKVTSWQTISNTVDLDYGDGRSYLLALSGGRMDVIDSEVAYLGWADGEPSGMSWRLRATDTRPETGSTGSIQNSNIHDNYFGLYSYQAYGLVATGNQFHHNLFYGFDPHTGSTGFHVAYNKVYANGKHGIIFSRGCTQNLIEHNEVYDNAQHAIMLDRGSDGNTIADNLVYNNTDGIAIFESSNNLVRNNTLRDNSRGVRINATYDVTDNFDGISTGNIVIGNTIQNNAEYGVYLYERADRNTLDGNSISGSVQAGVYVKTGGNQVVRNDIRANGVGISIVGGPLTPFPPGGPTPVPALEQPGANNIISANTIEDNDATGVQIKAGAHTLIGAAAPEGAPADGNDIRANGTYGVTLTTGTVDTTVSGNTIEANGDDGVLVKDSASARNRISRNSITANGGLGISLSGGANGGLVAPTIASDSGATVVGGTAPPGATVEVYRDPNGQGRFYKGSAVANGAGEWSLALPGDDDPSQGLLTALGIASNGDTSAFGGNLLGGTHAIYTVGAGRNGETTVFIGGPSANLTLPEIQQALQVISPTAQLLENQGNGVWQANASLLLNRGVTLRLTRDTVTWLKLRSQATGIERASGTDGTYDYNSFVTLRTYNGAILIDGVRVTSWDPAANDYDRDISNGRASVIAKYDARMDIRNADLSYLGSADGESYGVAWRDINDELAPDVLRTRVTGEVLNSNFSYNYYGIYTFQARDMVFRNNRFHHNIGYGFDPHDFSHHFMIEDNEAFQNGNHGFIISRGCNNFVFRRNRSYNNHYTVSAEARLAHGFMLDPGSPNSQFPQAPSHDNLLEDNQAWGNDGYGLRVVGSNANTIRGNSFTSNLQGITLEQGSTGNIVENNTIAHSGLYGIYLVGGADGNTLRGNTIAGSGRHGIYVKTGGNTIAQNTVADNGSLQDGVGVGSGIAFLQETTAAAAAADLTLPGARLSLAAHDPDLLGAPNLASAVAGNTVVQNQVVHNMDEGIELKSAIGSQVEGNAVEGNGSNGIYLAAGASGNTIKQNTASGNVGYGVRANGADVTHNTWTENSVFGNGAGGIANTSGANGGVQVPTIAANGLTASGTAAPGALIEIFSDRGGQARYFEGRATAGADGTFSFTSAQGWQGPNLNATATDSSGNSSSLARNLGEFVAFFHLSLPLVAR